MTFLSCMFVVILLTFCIDFVQINMHVCTYRTPGRSVGLADSDLQRSDSPIGIRCIVKCNRRKWQLQGHVTVDKTVNSGTSATPQDRRQSKLSVEIRTRTVDPYTYSTAYAAVSRKAIYTTRSIGNRSARASLFVNDCFDHRVY